MIAVKDLFYSGIIMRKTANIGVGELARHCIKKRVTALKTKRKHSYKQLTSPSCGLLAPPSGALVVSQFQDPVPTYRFGCSNLL